MPWFSYRGSTSTLDPYGTFTAWDGGTYYILVGDNTNVAAGVSTDITMAPGKNYVLNVSVSTMTDAVGSGAGNDYLDGGSGNNWLAGGLGNDSFYFVAPLGVGNVGTIADFSQHDDRILLDHNIFTGLSVCSLSSTAFDVWPRLRIDSATVFSTTRRGDLSIDQDGSGTAHQAIRFANIANHTSLSASDFLIV